MVHFVVAAGCVLGVISCAGCGASESQSRGAPIKSPAAARAENYKATSEYLRLRAEAIRATMAALPLKPASAEVVIAHARSECAGALRGTPAVAAAAGGDAMGVSEKQLLVAAGLGLEINGSILGRWAKRIFHAPLAVPAAQTFATKVASLHWADPRLANLVRAFVDVEAQLFAILPMDVCHVIRGWAATGYKTYPGEKELLRPHGIVGRTWQRALLAVGCGHSAAMAPATEAIVLAVLHPYERPGGPLTTQKIEMMETRLWETFRRSDWPRVEVLRRVLGLPPGPRRVSKKKLTPFPPVRDCAKLT